MNKLSITAESIKTVAGLARYISILPDDQEIVVDLKLVQKPPIKLTKLPISGCCYETKEEMLAAIVQEFGTRSYSDDDLLLGEDYQDNLIVDIIHLCKKHSIIIDDYEL